MYFTFILQKNFLRTFFSVNVVQSCKTRYQNKDYLKNDSLSFSLSFFHSILYAPWDYLCKNISLTHCFRCWLFSFSFSFSLRNIPSLISRLLHPSFFCLAVNLINEINLFLWEPGFNIYFIYRNKAIMSTKSVLFNFSVIKCYNFLSIFIYGFIFFIIFFIYNFLLFFFKFLFKLAFWSKFIASKMIFQNILIFSIKRLF